MMLMIMVIMMIMMMMFINYPIKRFYHDDDHPDDYHHDVDIELINFTFKRFIMMMMIVAFIVKLA